MLWWTLPIFLIVAVGVDYYLSRNRPALSGTIEQKLWVILLAPVFAPIIEELAFRWMPLKQFGFEAMIAFTVIWVLFHLKARYVPFYALMGTYFCYLWYIEMGWLAILIHVLWNTVNCLIIVKYKEPVLASWNFHDPSIPRVIWNSKEIGMYRAWAKKLWK